MRRYIGRPWSLCWRWETCEVRSPEVYALTAAYSCNYNDDVIYYLAMNHEPIRVTIAKDNPIIAALKQSLATWGEVEVDTGAGIYRLEVLNYTMCPKPKPRPRYPKVKATSRPLSYYNRFLVGTTLPGSEP